MYIVDFPFIQPIAQCPKRPMLWVRVTNPHSGHSIRTYGLIDTGADECALPARYADLLGHNLGAGPIKKVSTGGGITTAYSHTCKIEIFDTDAYRHGQENVVYTISEAPIDFMPHLNCVLLEVENFLGQFVLTVDYLREVFSLRKP